MISVQVLDGAYGHSAAGVRARLDRSSGKDWSTVADAQTSSDGRVEDLASWPLGRGLYRVVLDSDGYFAGLGVGTAYPEVIVVFRLRDESDSCQIKVTLSPHSYSAYLGAMDGESESSQATSATPAPTGVLFDEKASDHRRSRR
jgi:5-hydroxyisourate hydrolase